MSTADGCATGDPAYFAAQEPPQSRALFNMLHLSGGPVSRRPQRPIPLRTFLDTADDPNRGDNNQLIIDTVQAYYVDNGHIGDSPATGNLLVYRHLLSDADNFSRNGSMQPAFRGEPALFVALGWYVRTNETLRQFGKARIDVKLGHYHLMRVIFIIG